MQNRLFRKFAVVAYIICTLMLWAIYEWKAFLNTSIIPPDKSITYILKPGSSIKTLAFDLHKMGILSRPNFLIWLGYFQGITKNLQAGEYEFRAGTTPKQLLEQIVLGKVVLHSLTIVEGWNFQQVMEAIKNCPALQHTLNHATPMDVMANLGFPGENPEGRFFPDTYRFRLDSPDLSLLQEAFQKMQKHLRDEWPQRAANLPYQRPYDALIVASLIEKETSVPNERPLIAGVILNRINKNMRLQIDPTVIYGLGARYTGKLHKADLLSDTPYNTYLHHGLPPTPIAMPSAPAIRAALHPVQGSLLYFVAKGDGSHTFSSTLEQHNNAVMKYKAVLKAGDHNAH